MRHGDLFGEYQRVPVVVEESVKRGVRAILIQSTRLEDLLYDQYQSREADRLPGLIVAREDAEQAGASAGPKIRVSIDISAKPTTGPIHTANVVAELRGRRKARRVRGAGSAPRLVGAGPAHSTMAANAALVMKWRIRTA